jgi:lyso-ornithine lipid O-acyltransferase
VAWRVARLVALLIAYTPLHGLWSLARRHSPWPQRFLAGASRAAGVDVRVVGEPLRRDVLYVANHLSWLDILVVTGATGARFVAKDEVRHWPLIGWLARQHDTVFVARTERGRVHHQADQLRAALGEHVPVMLFPEGGTGNGRAVGPFRASLLAALSPSWPELRLQPLALDYGAEAPRIAWLDDLPVIAEAVRILAMPGRRQLVLHALPPIDPAALPDRKALTAAARDALRRALGETLGETGPQPV